MQKIVFVPIRDLKEHPENEKIFGPSSEEEDEILLESIKEKGVVSPILITRDGKILGGHRRVRAAARLGMTEVPCLVFDPKEPGQEDEIFFEDNLSQRQLTPFKAYKALEKYKTIRKRRHLLSGSDLIPEFKALLQEKKISLKTAESLSSLSPEEQKSLLESVESFFQQRLQDLNREELARLESLVREKDEALAKTSRKLGSYAEEVRKLKEAMTEGTRLRSELQERLDLLRREKEALERRLEELREEKKNNPEMAELRKKVRELSEKEKRYLSEIEEYRSRLSALEDEVKRREEELERFRREFQTLLYQKLREKEKELEERAERMRRRTAAELRVLLALDDAVSLFGSIVNKRTDASDRFIEEAGPKIKTLYRLLSIAEQRTQKQKQEVDDGLGEENPGVFPS